MFRNVLLMLILVFSCPFAQNVDEAVEQYVKKFTSDDANNHRSGKINPIEKIENLRGDDYIDDIDDDRTEGDYSLSLTWYKKNMYEYQLDYKPNKRFKKKMKRLEKKFSLDYDSVTYTYTVTPKDLEESLSIKNKDGHQFTNMMLREYFPMFRGKYEFDFLITEENELVEKQIGYRYRRIFKHGILRKNISYIEVWYDYNENLKNVYFKWPQMKRLNDSPIISIKEALEMTKNMLNENFITGKIMDGYKIDGVSLAWLPLQGNHYTYISPCYSFKIIDIKNAPNEESSVEFVDIPALERENKIYHKNTEE